jgi:dTDP-glucose 4,6-dehydratase
LTRSILDQVGKPSSLVRLIADRPGHDRRYSLDCSKVRGLGWQPAHDFREALAATVDWYRSREDWWRPIKDGSFREYYERQYSHRLTSAVELG